MKKTRWIVAALCAACVSSGARASLTLFDFENEAEAKIVPERRHGEAYVTNFCATSGSSALWMGPEGAEPPSEDYGFATVSWTDRAKDDWSRFDRLVFDVTNLSGDGRSLVLYLYDTDMKKRKGARFSVKLPAASTKRVEIALDWSKLAVQTRNMRAIALVHCSPQYGQIVLDRFTLLEKGDVPPPVTSASAFKDACRAFAKVERAYLAELDRRLEAKEVARIAEMKRQLDADVTVQAKKLAAFVRGKGITHGRMALAQATGMDQIRPRQTDFSCLRPIGSGLRLRLAQGEYEGAQIAVSSADAESLGGVRLTVEGEAAKLLKIETAPVGYVFADAPTAHRQAYCVPSATNLCGYVRRTRETPLGWYADPILPFLGAVDVAPGDVQSFHVRVHAPEDCQAGTYAGRLVVTATNAPPVTVPFAVRVDGFKIGKVSELPLLVSFTPYVQPISLSWRNEQAEEVRRDPEAPVNLWRRHRFEWADFLMEYFITPSTIYPARGDTIPDFDLVKRAAEKGRYGYFTVGPWSLCTDEKVWRKEFLEPLKKRVAAAKAAGLDRWMVAYGCDETREEFFPAIRRALDILKAELPGLPIVTTAFDSELGVGSHLAGVDWFVPLTKAWNPEKVSASRAKGHKVLWYVACGELPPLANLFVESPLSEGRLLMGAQALRMKPDGFLYYAVSKWNHRRPITSGPFTDWSPHGIRHRHKKAYDGDGVWAYCGPDGMPVATLRLENFRDGIEDYNIAKRLERLLTAHADQTDAWSLAARAAIDVPLAVMESMTNYTDCADVIYAWRDRMADLIEAELARTGQACCSARADARELAER